MNKVAVFGLVALLATGVANARNDGGENGNGCVNNCGNGGQTTETPAPEVPAFSSTSTQGQLQGQLQGQDQGQAQSAAASASSTSNATSGAEVVTGDVSNDSSIGVAVGVSASPSVTVKTKEAANAVGIVLTTACGQSVGVGTPGYTVNLGKGQDAFCKELVLANLFLELGDLERAMVHVDRAEDLAGLDSAFDQILTVLTLGLIR